MAEANSAIPTADVSLVGYLTGTEEIPAIVSASLSAEQWAQIILIEWEKAKPFLAQLGNPISVAELETQIDGKKLAVGGFYAHVSYPRIEGNDYLPQDYRSWRVINPDQPLGGYFIPISGSDNVSFTGIWLCRDGQILGYQMTSSLRAGTGQLIGRECRIFMISPSLIRKWLAERQVPHIAAIGFLEGTRDLLIRLNNRRLARVNEADRVFREEYAISRTRIR